jgi:hypothetical protein
MLPHYMLFEVWQERRTEFWHPFHNYCRALEVIHRNLSDLHFSISAIPKVRVALWLLRCEPAASWTMMPYVLDLCLTKTSACLYKRIRPA